MARAFTAQHVLLITGIDATVHGCGGINTGTEKPNGFDQQGYDSRGVNYDPALTIKYAFKLQADRSLISTISAETYDATGFRINQAARTT